MFMFYAISLTKLSFKSLFYFIRFIRLGFKSYKTKSEDINLCSLLYAISLVRLSFMTDVYVHCFLL